MSEIDLNYELGPKHPTVHLVGNIGERINLYGMPLEGIEEITIDFEKVNYINSIGVKNWIFWISRIPQKLKVHFTHCIPAIVNQLNSVIGFIPLTGIVESFYIPYTCDHCGWEDRIKAERGKSFEYPSPQNSPQYQASETIPCPKCQAEMSLDILPMRYFNFLTGPKKNR